jgi:Rad3-related DNA helicase
VEAVRSVIAGHPGEKGLIHAQNYVIAQALMAGVGSDRLITHGPKDRALVLARFKASADPLVLVSPSMTTGVDLPYEACRFQVVAKLPFPDRGDPQVRRRLEVGPDGTPGGAPGERWYAWATACGLIQACGRGVRAEDDYCATYILDSNLGWFRRAYHNLFPRWFTEAWV